MDGNYDVQLQEDENTPPSSDQCPKQRRTPLPWLQISIMLLLHTCEPISSQSIYPYINEVFSFCFLFCTISLRSPGIACGQA
jgi:hypothetical protein